MAITLLRSLYNTRSICWLFLLFLHCNTLQAATYLNQTRLVIQEKNPDISFSLINQGENPALMQLWIDKDNVLDRPELIKLPFLILPPIFRLDAKKTRAVRIQLIDNNEGLDKDKESLFWLNVLEVPPKPLSAKADSILQIAFRTRIKVFFRPSSIMNATLYDGVKNIQTSHVNCVTGNCLRLESNSPLHITLLSLSFTNNKVIDKLPNDGMIAPFSTIDIPLPDTTTNQLKVLTWVDDYGVANDFIK